ncbi:metallophosphoesterase [Paenibacillus sp. GCM10027626]|uniref:metallophosphoesterase n=1 Tax=Paenibacillus sp. GCM10027626 TaxID=3273411 RepID=UPI00362AC6EA
MVQERTLVISDIHGCDKELEALLQQSGYDAGKDTLLLLGDYVDRGLRSKQAVDLVRRLVLEQGAVALQGNHDQRFVRVMTNKANEEEIEKFFEKGGAETLSSYMEMKAELTLAELEHYKASIMTSHAAHIQFLEGLPYYYEDDHYIYVHAGLNPKFQDWKSQPVKDFLFIRKEFYTHPTQVDKTVIFGHTKTIDIHGVPDVWYGGDKIGIDGGCAFGYQLNCLEIIDGTVNQVFVQPANNSTL